MSKKIGEGHLERMGGLGLRELQGAVYPESNVAQTPQHGHTHDERDQDAQPSASIVDDRLNQIKDADDRDDNSPEMDLEK